MSAPITKPCPCCLGEGFVDKDDIPTNVHVLFEECYFCDGEGYVETPNP